MSHYNLILYYKCNAIRYKNRIKIERSKEEGSQCVECCSVGLDKGRCCQKWEEQGGGKMS